MPSMNLAKAQAIVDFLVAHPGTPEERLAAINAPILERRTIDPATSDGIAIQVSVFRALAAKLNVPQATIDEALIPEIRKPSVARSILGRAATLADLSLAGKVVTRTNNMRALQAKITDAWNRFVETRVNPSLDDPDSPGPTWKDFQADVAAET